MFYADIILHVACLDQRGPWQPDDKSKLSVTSDRGPQAERHCEVLLWSLAAGTQTVTLSLNQSAGVGSSCSVVHGTSTDWQQFDNLEVWSLM